MIGGCKVLAIVPARGGSKGFPRKNVHPLGGRPLVAWPVTAARGARCVDEVVVSTDDDAIAAAATAHGARVPFRRPAELATDTASSMDVIRHALETLAAAGECYEYVVLLEPTSPLTESADVDAAIESLHDARDRADAIVGISRVEAAHPEYDVKLDAAGLIRPYAAADFRSLRRRQEIDELYFLEGSVYVSEVAAFLRTGSFYHERTLGYAVPRWKSLEIDDFFDLVCAEALLARRDEIHAHERALRLASATNSELANPR